ncbi:glycosyltransferase family 4 protein [Flavobacteriaceae bacterium]|nr:glycosyltransferase family 4 protein [Flavobacteriaceae bacterium]
MNRYLYCNDIPLGFANGGKENQLKFVKDVAKKFFDFVGDLNHVKDIRLNNNDVVHLFGDSPSFFYLLKFLKGSNHSFKTIISPNFYRRNYIYYKILKLIPSIIPNWYSERLKLYKEVDVIIVNSNHEKQYLKLIFGNWILKKIHVVYNTFDPPHNHSPESKEIKSDYYFMASHLSERKNVFQLLIASDSIYKNNKLKLHIAGDLRFFEKKNKIKFNDMLKKRPWVVYHGLLSKIKLDVLYNNCLFHILPSFIESPGISNLEALSRNKKIIVGDFPILREYFKSEAIYSGFSSKKIIKSVESLIHANDFTSKFDLSFCSSKIISEKYGAIFKNIIGG